eukprot:jgi/Orpsp1_1/1182633/evm.model.c7180000082047.1
MKQIGEMVGVNLVTPPPNDKSAMIRVSEIFDIPFELLTMSNGKICLIQSTLAIPLKKNNYSSIQLEKKSMDLWH